jgi:hypothetical protein
MHVVILPGATAAVASAAVCGIAARNDAAA